MGELRCKGRRAVASCCSKRPSVGDRTTSAAMTVIAMTVMNEGTTGTRTEAVNPLAVVVRIRPLRAIGTKGPALLAGNTKIGEVDTRTGVADLMHTIGAGTTDVGMIVTSAVMRKGPAGTRMAINAGARAAKRPLPKVTFLQARGSVYYFSGSVGGGL